MNALIQKPKHIIGITNYHRSIQYLSSAGIYPHKIGKYKSNETDHLKILHSTNQSSASCINLNLHRHIQSYYLHSNNTIRYLSTNSIYHQKPSSKVEETIQVIKEKEKEDQKLKVQASQKQELKDQQESKDEVRATTVLADDKKIAIPTAETTTSVVAPPESPKKKSLPTRIWEEIVHYYHGFRLLFIDFGVCSKLLWQILNGESLTRREHRLLLRTTSDFFRLVPFSVFIIVPFMELLLPVVIKFFPGMLPSTFQTAKDEEDKMKQSLKVKLEMAKFLQKTLDEMAVQSKDHKSQDAKDFTEFFVKIRSTGTAPTNEEIMKFSKVFEDEITLDSLTRPQLIALCRVLEINTIGTTNFLQFQLRYKLRSLAADDRAINKEGIDSLTLGELQSACRARGMRAYGMSRDRLKLQLQEWINLSLNEKVPPSLLLLSRALMLPEHVPTSDKLKATIAALPETIVAQTKAAIGEREGKIDNKTQIEIIKEEQRKIKEEAKEEKESKDTEKILLVDKAPTIDADDTQQPKLVPDVDPILVANAVEAAKKESVSQSDLGVLGEALHTLSKDTKTMLVEKEEIKDLKEEIKEYEEDVQELKEVTTQAPEISVKESKAAKNLFNKVNSMIAKLEKDLEKSEKRLKEAPVVEAKEVEDQLVRVDELLTAVQKMQKVPDEARLSQIERILGKMDADRDGQVRVEDLLKVIELMGKETVKLSTKQVDEIIDLLTKEEQIENEDKLEKALAKTKKAAEELVDNAKTIDASSDENLKVEKNGVKVVDKLSPISEEVVKEAIEKQTDKILPKDSSTSPPIPPQIPTKPKDKML